MKFNLIKGNTLKCVSALIFCSHDATRSSWEMLRTPAIDCMRRALRALPRPRRVHSRCTCGPSPVTRTCPRTSPGWPRAPRPAPHRLGPLPLHVPSGDLLLSFRDQLAQPPGRDLGLRPSPSPPLPLPPGRPVSESLTSAGSAVSRPSSASLPPTPVLALRLSNVSPDHSNSHRAAGPSFRALPAQLESDPESSDGGPLVPALHGGGTWVRKRE